MVEGTRRTATGAGFGASVASLSSEGGVRVFQENERQPAQRSIVSIPVTQVDTTLTTILTVQADRFIHPYTMKAYAPASTTLNVYFVPDGGTADATNLAFSGVIVDNATIFSNKDEMLDPGDTVQVHTTSGTANIRLWGAQVEGGDPL